MSKPFWTGVTLGLMLGIPCVAFAAWSRTYGFGGRFPLSGGGVATFMDDTAMPMKSLSKLDVFVDNQSPNASTSSADVRCCYRSKSNTDPPGYGCGTATAGPTGKGTKLISVTAADKLSYCKDATTVPFLVVDSTTGELKSMYLVAVTASGN